MMNRFLTSCLAVAGLAFLVGCGSESSETSSPTSSVSETKKFTIYLVPKKKGLPYFSSCASGAMAAAADLGNVELIYDGPTDGSPEKQAAMIETFTLKGADVIAVSPNDPDVVAPAMRKAREKGVHVITWDADGVADSREFFVNQATAEAIAYGMVDTMVADLGGTRQDMIAGLKFQRLETEVVKLKGRVAPARYAIEGQNATLHGA